MTVSRGGGIAVATRGDYLYLASGMLFLLLPVSLIVVCPAVWSRRPTRRRAAQHTLGLLLGRNTRTS